MKNKLHQLGAILTALFFVGSPAMAEDAKGQLILLAAPELDSPYYAGEVDAIIDFHIEFAKRIAAPDRVLVLAGADTVDRYEEALGSDRVTTAAMGDVWARDFGIMDAGRNVMVRYTAAGQIGTDAGQGDDGMGQFYADEVQEALAEFLEESGVDFGDSDLLNDGGNWVYDGAGHAVVSTKFLADNQMSETEARAALRSLTGASEIAFVEADDVGGLEHADGMVSFIDDGVLLVNDYGDSPDYENKLLADLKRGLPSVAIHTIVAPYDDSNIQDERFGSACGIYTNALVTHHAVYLPQFGVAEDAQALEAVQALTDKQVIPVPSQGVCHLGGGVRCMSSQIDLGRSGNLAENR
ncbi:MAG: agmatine deiminase family protein [Pseudomonadota bacterium]